MQKKNKYLLKNIGLFTIGSFGSKILSFLLVPLYTAVLSTAEYGSVDLITSTASLLTPILLLSIFDATLCFGMDPEYKKEDVLSTSINIAIKGSLILIVGVVVVSITHLFNISSVYLVFLCIYFILGALSQILNLYLRAKNQAAVIAVSGIICTLITCVSNIVLLLVFKWGIVGYMISSTIGVLIQNLYQLFIGKVYKDIRFRNYTDLSKPMIKYSSPLIANSISWWVNNASDRYILTFLRGVAENGVYSVSYKIPTILYMFQGIFYNAWSISAIAEFDEDDSDGFIGTNYSMYSFISLAVCSGLLIINIPLATFLYKGDYFVAWKCVPFLLMGTVFSGISQFEGSLFAATRNTKSVAKTTVIGAVVNTICNFIFIYFIGAIGAALATLLGYLTTWCLRTKSLQDFIKMKVNWTIHFISIIIVIAQSCMATLGVSPFIQVIPFVVLVVMNRKFIVPVLNKVLKR
ncbi:multidrug transporter [Clostridium sp. DMHC 10]|uniref:lipopolysaccharide biosynthesis protein n=1 Tax=Clostridium sp. DMHC 10 TaxID=747377 RepID=UPI00069E4C51|nr:polysaccharide biosynthesis C-terminal domain-containing protein [Clostridium sp. DMHC 10]KOF57149.1 multidrug transporter [Clostridium sp. DMHC 10]